MLSITNRAVLCLAGLALSGCMQSMPTAESLTRPTVEAFARLNAWTPWGPKPEQAPPLVIADTPPAPPEAAPVPPPPPPPAIRPVELRRPVVRSRPAPPPDLATTRAVPVATVPVRASTPPDGAKLVPATISCQTISRPGERVRMECKPAN